MNKNDQKNSQLDLADAVILLFIMTLSFATRMHHIYHPQEVSFDEIYFGNFTNYYLKGIYFYDIHPPFGKLLMAGVAKLAEYNGDINFEKSYYHNIMYVTLRLTPALFGSMCFPLMYLSMRFVSFSKLSSTVSALIAIMDTSMITEHRFILSDAMLHFTSCLFICTFSYALSLPEYSKKWRVWNIISGFTLGMCSSCKNTAWGFIGYVAIIHTLKSFKSRHGIDILDIIWRGAHLAVPLIIVYLGSFAVHFILLPYDGPGVEFVHEEDRKMFLNRKVEEGRLWGLRLSKPGLLWRTIELAVDMYYGNMGITSFHHGMSFPWNWPLLTGRWVDFWYGGSCEIHCMGNPILYYITFASIFVILLGYRRPLFQMSIRYVIAWAVCYFPFYLVPRTMYLYHYILPLICASMSVGAALDLWLEYPIKGVVGLLIVSVVFVGFILFKHLSYGSQPSAFRFWHWTDNWLNGDARFKKLRSQN